jgi:hypothetical protein
MKTITLNAEQARLINDGQMASVWVPSDWQPPKPYSPGRHPIIDLTHEQPTCLYALVDVVATKELTPPFTVGEEVGVREPYYVDMWAPQTYYGKADLKQFAQGGKFIKQNTGEDMKPEQIRNHVKIIECKPEFRDGVLGYDVKVKK